MAYDRYDRQRGHEDPRQTEHGERGRRGERGFFERAGDEIASWFGDEDDDRERRQRSERGRDEWGDFGRSPSERDYRSGADRDFGGSEGYRPLTGDYGRSQEDRGGYGRPQGSGSGRGQDRHYDEWRQRQLDELDRDYDEYHRERQQHFENDFGSWRQTRQQKRSMLSQAREHMDVVGSDGEPLGRVDRVAGDRLILTKSDSPDGRHHSIPCTMIDSVEGDCVKLDCTAKDAQKQWRDDDRERALFEREDRGEAGPHMLDRSFSGTYRR